MLIDQLRLAVATQQDAEVVEPADNALELDTIDEEDGERRLRLAHAVQERVLQILFLFGRFPHNRFPHTKYTALPNNANKYVN